MASKSLRQLQARVCNGAVLEALATAGGRE